MRPFEQAWGLVKGFRHKFGPVTHFHGVRSVESEDYIEPRNLPDGGLIDSFGRPRLTLKAMRQTELGEHHPDFPSSHGPVIYVHGTANYNYPSIREKGLIANDYPYNGYYGNFVSTNPEVKDWYGRNRDWRRPNRSSEPMLIGVRAGAGTPQPYFGYENDEEERIFANHWRFPNNIDPKYLVNMGDEVPKVLPDFYVDGKPPDFPEGLSGFDLDAWEKKWGKQT